MWINFSVGMDKQLHETQTVARTYLSIPKLQWYTCWSLGMEK